MTDKEALRCILNICMYGEPDGTTVDYSDNVDQRLSQYAAELITILSIADAQLAEEPDHE